MFSIENSINDFESVEIPNILAKSDSLNMPIQLKNDYKKRIGEYIYKLDQMIGYGYNSQVYKGCHQVHKEQFYAIKVIKLKSLTKLEYRLLKNQMKIIKNLRHENILQFHDYHFSKNHAYIITDYCEGGTLQDYISKKKQNNITQQEFQHIFGQISEGCKYLVSNNILHRDIKPANILLKENTWKIGDFGFSQILENQQSILHSRYLIGSPLYMPPQSLRHNTYSLKTDSFALGVTLFYLATKQFPWNGKTVQQILSAYQQNEFPQNKLSLLPQKYKNIITMLCKLDIGQRILITEALNKNSKCEQISNLIEQKDNIEENTQILKDLNLIEKVKLCKFVIFLYQNLKIKKLGVNKELIEGMRKFINLVMIVFREKNQYLVKQHFLDYEYSQKKQFTTFKEINELLFLVSLQKDYFKSKGDENKVQVACEIKLAQFQKLSECISEKNENQLSKWMKSIVLHPDFENISPSFFESFKK